MVKRGKVWICVSYGCDQQGKMVKEDTMESLLHDAFHFIKSIAHGEKAIGLIKRYRKRFPGRF